MNEKIRVYRQDHRGTGVLESEHDIPSEAIKAAVQGKKNAKPSPLTANVWYVAFPLQGGRWDCWYVS